MVSDGKYLCRGISLSIELQGRFYQCWEMVRSEKQLARRQGEMKKERCSDNIHQSRGRNVNLEEKIGEQLTKREMRDAEICQDEKQ